MTPIPIQLLSQLPAEKVHPNYILNPQNTPIKPTNEQPQPQIDSPIPTQHVPTPPPEPVPVINSTRVTKSPA